MKKSNYEIQLGVRILFDIFQPKSKKSYVHILLGTNALILKLHQTHNLE